LQSERFGPVTR